jgi:hypothetical protein
MCAPPSRGVLLAISTTETSDVEVTCEGWNSRFGGLKVADKSRAKYEDERVATMQ